MVIVWVAIDRPPALQVPLKWICPWMADWKKLSSKQRTALGYILNTLKDTLREKSHHNLSKKKAAARSMPNDCNAHSALTVTQFMAFPVFCRQSTRQAGLCKAFGFYRFICPFLELSNCELSISSVSDCSEEDLPIGLTGNGKLHWVSVMSLRSGLHTTRHCCLCRQV